MEEPMGFMKSARFLKRIAPLAIATAVLTITNVAGAVRYQRQSAIVGNSGYTRLDPDCLYVGGPYVYVDTTFCGLSLPYQWVMAVPTEWRSGTQSYNVWVTASDAHDGIQFADATSYYKDGTIYTYTNFNSGSSLASGTDHYVSVNVPQDGYILVHAELGDGDGVSSYAWEFIY